MFSKIKRMKRRKYFGIFLLMVSMLVLIVPVLPHHHHYDDDICFHHDDDASTPAHHQSNPDCDGYCITNLHFSVQHYVNTVVQPLYFQDISLFTRTILNSLLPSKLEIFNHFYYYIEFLHGADISRTISLRAPPTL